jgi:hypothetical protein
MDVALACADALALAPEKLCAETCGRGTTICGGAQYAHGGGDVLQDWQP